MIDGVEYYPINLIDEEETIKNGKRICVLYRPLIEKRMKQILTTPMNSASIVTFTGNQRNNHAFEDKLIERCAWNDDQVTKFINNILILEQSDKIAGQFLKEKYIYDKYDKEILEDMILIAVNDGLKKISKMKEEKMGKYTGGLGGLF